MKCTKCGGHIHSSRQLCNKCAGVEVKAFEKAPTKTRGGYVNDKWVSGRTKARIAGMDELRGMFE